MRKKKIKIPVKNILILCFCLMIVILSLWLLGSFLTTSSYFKIKDFDYRLPLDGVARQHEHSYLKNLIGKNIFKIDLQEEAQRLSRIFPDYKKITLHLQLPDRIIVNFKPRQIVAALKVSEYFYVDEEGVLFSPSNTNDRDALNKVSEGIDALTVPFIVGLDARIVSPRSGVKCNDASLQAVLRFIMNFKKNKVLTEIVKIKEINLVSINDIFLFTKSNCKINLGSVDSLDKDLLILQKVIEATPDLTNIEYIDLRFREPVVKYK